MARRADRLVHVSGVPTAGQPRTHPGRRAVRVAGGVTAVLAGMAAGLVAYAQRTARLEAEVARLRKTTTDLETAQTVKDEMLAMANHELRSPLTAIIGYASTLRRMRTEDVDDRRGRYLGYIESEARRLAVIVNDLESMTAFQAGAVPIRADAVGLRAAVDEVLARWPDRHLSNVCTVDDVAIADPDRLHQVLVNLLSNAIKYGAEPVEVSAAADGDWIDLCVRDHGPGVAPVFVPRLFQAFAREDNARAEGAGLGLAVVDQLVRGQGGKVWYADAPGGGASFTVRLPIHVDG